MTDTPNYTNEVFNIFLAGDVKEAVQNIVDKDGPHLVTAVTFGGMFLMMMAEFGYSDPKDVWQDLAQYHDLRNS